MGNRDWLERNIAFKMNKHVNYPRRRYMNGHMIGWCKTLFTEWRDDIE